MTLLEKKQELGGNFRIAAYPTGKGQLTEAVRSMIVRCENAGVAIRAGVEADETVLKAFCPDAIVLATGSNPLILRIPGLAECGFMTAQELLDGKRSAGRKALVVGCEAAEFLAERGHEVSVIEMKDVIAADVTPESRRYMFETFREHNVGLYPGAKVGQFHTDGVDYTIAAGRQAASGASTALFLPWARAQMPRSRRRRRPCARRSSSSARQQRPPATRSPQRPMRFMRRFRYKYHPLSIEAGAAREIPGSSCGCFKGLVRMGLGWKKHEIDIFLSIRIDLLESVCYCIHMLKTLCVISKTA